MKALDYIETRHKLHELAEPSGEECKTQAFILDTLQAFKPTKVHTFEETKSIVAVYDFGSGPVTLVRGDFDAVRVPETLELSYASQTLGVAHKCGHDGHTTILLGLAEQLHLHPLEKGTVLLLFQAAEETGAGAQQLLDTKILDRYHPNKAFALHNIPGEPIGTVLCKTESFTCAVVSCDIELHGRTSHAAEPLKAISPYPTAKTITDKVLALNRYNMMQADYCLATLVEFRVGEQAYGVTAGHGVLRFTLRAKDDQVLQQAKDAVCKIVEDAVAVCDGLTSQVSWKEYFAASKNHPDAVAQVQAAASNNGLPYKQLELPFSWGEDFGLFTQHYDGALLGLGSGEQQPPLHHQLFNFPDELVPIGVRLFYQILESQQ